MALTDIVAPPGNSSTLLMERGDIGTVTDIQAKAKNEMLIEPAPSSGGNIFIMSE